MKRAASLLLALMLALALTACGGGKDDGSVKAEDGYGEGGIGSLMKSYFFDYTVNSAALADSYGSYTPAEGCKALVVNMTVTNTYQAKEAIEMYDTDFLLEWGPGDEEAAFPITTDPETGEEIPTVSDQQLPYIYNLEHKESRTGDLVFEVPEGVNDFALAMLEMFDDGTDEGSTGDLFAVNFTVE